MLCAVEVLAGELTDSHGEAFVERSLFDPPRIKPERVLACHSAGTGQEPKIRPDVGSILPECSRMKIPSWLVYQSTKIDVDSSSDSIPGNKVIIAIAHNVCERIADVLKVEPHSSLEQIRPNTTPVS